MDGKVVNESFEKGSKFKKCQEPLLEEDTPPQKRSDLLFPLCKIKELPLSFHQKTSKLSQ